MIVAELERELLARHPKADAEGWDHVGLSVGNPAAEITGVACALDATEANVHRAQEAGANVLLTHHPIYIKAPEAFCPADATRPQSSAALYEAARCGVSIISLHTNLDRSHEARVYLSELLGAAPVSSLEHVDNPEATGLGALATLNGPCSLRDLAARASTAFGSDPRVWGEAEHACRTVAILGGSLGDFGELAIAAGADVIVLDVKCGGGAFMKTEEQARELARNLTRIGNMAGRKTSAVITDMDQPLGCAVGNAVEVKEAISVLSGETQGDLLELCLTLGSCMLVSAGFAKDDDEARAELMETIRSGKALQKLADLVEAQGGDADAVYEPSMLPDAKVKLEVPSTEAGYVSHINAEEVGLVSMHLGGGRATKESTIDLSVGVVLVKKLGDRVEAGESLGTIHASSMEKAQEAAELLRGCYKFSTAPVERPAFIKGIVR